MVDKSDKIMINLLTRVYTFSHLYMLGNRRERFFQSLQYLCGKIYVHVPQFRDKFRRKCFGMSISSKEKGFRTPLSANENNFYHRVGVK